MKNTEHFEQLKNHSFICGCSISKAYALAKQYIADNNLSDTVAMRYETGVVLVTNGKLPNGFKWQAYKGKRNRMRVVKEMELSA